MKYDQGRLWVRLISQQAFRQYMDFRSETNRSLADKCGKGVERGIISHLRSGARTTCSPKTAIAIERALNAPPGSLFVAEVSSVGPGNGRALAGAK